MEYLRKDDVILINRMTLKRHGGNFVPPFNFLHEDSLDYLVEAVKAKMYDAELYPEIYDKAGLYMFSIISNHVFQDGNKRTGLESALLFLKLNGLVLKERLVKLEKNRKISKTGLTSEDILTEFTIEVASGELKLEEIQSWFKENMIKL